MEIVGIFLAGFASGWAVRTTVDSSRSLAVNVLSKLYAVADRATRAVEMEREHIEDLLAEARAKFEADRARTARNDQGVRRAPVATPIHQDRAA
jgi:nicotinamidase-related amidase